MSAKLLAKEAEINELRDSLQKKYDEIGEDDPTLEQYEACKDLNKQIEEKEHDFLRLNEIEHGREANQKALAELEKPRRRSSNFVPDEKDREASRVDPAFEQAMKGGWEQWIEQNKAKGVPTTGIESPRVEVKGLVTGASDTSGGAFVRREYDETVPLGMRILQLRDIISVASIESDIVEYVRQTLRTNNAAVVAEATATGGSSGVKPESNVAYEIVQAMVKTIATWIPLTRRVLADAGQMRDLVETDLRFMIRETLESQMITGDGVGENFTGLENTSGMLSQAYVTSLLTTTRKARTKLRKEGKVIPTAWLMSLDNWEEFDLLQDGENRYFFGGPLVMGNPRLWGVPVVESEFKTNGDAILADFRWAKLWDREQDTIYVTDSHSDNFIRNILVMLAELRAAFGVKRPTAFIEVDLTA